MSTPQVSEQTDTAKVKNRQTNSREKEKALQEKKTAHNSLITDIQDNLRYGQGSIAATEDVDGMTLYGLIATGGSVARMLGKALEDFRDSLDSDDDAEEKKGIQKDRFEDISERFNRLVQRTDNLSRRAEQVDLNRREENFRDSVAEITEEFSELEENHQKAVIGEELEGSLRLLSDHLDKIGQTAGIEQEPSGRIDFDISFPADQQLEQLEAILQELESRVDELDEKLTELESSDFSLGKDNKNNSEPSAEQSNPPEQLSAPASRSSNTATKLADAFKATTIVKGTLLTDPLYTSVGRIDYRESDTKEEIIVTDEGNRGVIFKAEKEAGMSFWQTKGDEDKLTDEERKRISHAPSTEEEVAAHNIITTLQRSYPDAFQQGEEIRVGDETQGFYTFNTVQQGVNRSIFGKDSEQAGFLHVQERADGAILIFHFSDPVTHAQNFDRAIAVEQQHRDKNAALSGVRPRAPAVAYEL